MLKYNRKKMVKKINAKKTFFLFIIDIYI